MTTNDEVAAAISVKEARSERQANLIKLLKAKDRTIRDFDEDLWGGTINFIMMGRDKEIKVTFSGLHRDTGITE